MRRTCRKLSAETKLKISMSMKGRMKTEKHKEALSRSLKAYWESIPKENNDLPIINND